MVETVESKASALTATGSQWHSTTSAHADAHWPAAIQSCLPALVLPKVTEHIAAHIETALRVAILAATEGYSASHFSRCFRNSTGMTPHAMSCSSESRW